MSVPIADFQSQVLRIANIFRWYGPWRSELTTIATALGTDPTIHDTTIQTPPTALLPGNPANDKYQNEIALVINRGKGGGLTTAAMATAISNVAAGP